jgi:hypothetical protein
MPGNECQAPGSHPVHVLFLADKMLGKFFRVSHIPSQSGAGRTSFRQCLACVRHFWLCVGRWMQGAWHCDKTCLAYARHCVRQDFLEQDKKKFRFIDARQFWTKSCWCQSLENAAWRSKDILYSEQGFYARHLAWSARHALHVQDKKPGRVEVRLDKKKSCLFSVRH